jgi:hypothetical protein
MSEGNKDFDPAAEWAKANKGRWKRRLPVVFGFVTALALGGVGAAVSIGMARAAETAAGEREARGEVLRCYGRGGIRYGKACESPISGGLLLICIPGLLAFVGFVMGYAFSGGQISSEYIRGAKELGKKAIE